MASASAAASAASAATLASTLRPSVEALVASAGPAAARDLAAPPPADGRWGTHRDAPVRGADAAVSLDAARRRDSPPRLVTREGSPEQRALSAGTHALRRDHSS